MDTLYNTISVHINAYCLENEARCVCRIKNRITKRTPGTCNTNVKTEMDNKNTNNNGRYKRKVKV